MGKLVFVICLFVVLPIYGQPAMESHWVSSVSIPFGFSADPLPNLVLPQSTLTFKEGFYFGPCTVNSTSPNAVYGPSWNYVGKYSQGIYSVPFHNWGISFDTRLRLNTSALKTKMQQSPGSFAQVRYTGTRTKAWMGTTVVLSQYLPYWTLDTQPYFANDFNPTTGSFSRVTSDGSEFYLWDKPGLTDTVILSPLWADSAIKYNDFTVQFWEDINGTSTHHSALDQNFYTKLLLIWNANCTWGIDGNSASGPGWLPYLPDWQFPVTSTSFPE